MSKDVKKESIAKILVKNGQVISKDEPAIFIEAMKMETTINAEKSGTIKLINIESGDNVETKDLLIEIN